MSLEDVERARFLDTVCEALRYVIHLDESDWVPEPMRARLLPCSSLARRARDTLHLLEREGLRWLNTRSPSPPTTEDAERLVAELMAEARQKPTTSRKLEPISTELLTPTEIRVADAGGRLVVDDLGHGLVYPTRADADAERSSVPGKDSACGVGRELFGYRVGYPHPHPSGCHTEAPGSRDCESDGHESCGSCSRRTERDEQVWREGGIVVPPRDRAK